MPYRLVPIALGLLLLPSLGCNYFRPTRPEIPIQGGIQGDYSTPDHTLETIQLAIQAKSTSGGDAAYRGAFASLDRDGEEYSATFDPITVARFPGADTDWDLGREQIFYSNLSRLLPSSAFVFTWGDWASAGNDRPDETPAVFYRSYRILATPDDGASFVPVARGNVELHMKRFGTDWRIVLWIDSEDPQADFDLGELSFGQLRLAGP